MYSRYAYEIVGGVLIFVSSLVGEQMPPRLKKLCYGMFALCAVGYILIGVYLDKDASRQQGRLEQTIADLRQSSKDAENARRSDRDVFFAQFAALSRQVTDLRAHVQTEALRKQLDETLHAISQNELELRKREVVLHFMINGQPDNQSAIAVKRDEEGRVILSFAIINDSPFDTGSGLAEIKLMSCAKNNCRIFGVDAWPYWNDAENSVGRDFMTVPKHVVANLGKLQIFADTGSFDEVQIATRYRCILCAPDEWRPLTIKISN